MNNAVSLSAADVSFFCVLDLCTFLFLELLYSNDFAIKNKLGHLASSDQFVGALCQNLLYVLTYFLFIFLLIRRLSFIP